MTQLGLFFLGGIPRTTSGIPDKFRIVRIVRVVYANVMTL